MNRSAVLSAARHRLPASATPLLVRAAVRRSRANPELMGQARAEMRFILGEDASEAELERVTLAYLVHRRWRHEAMWHPERHMPPLPVHGADRLLAADGGIVGFMHYGHYERVGVSAGAAGVELHGMVSAALLADDATPLERHSGLALSRGAHPFSAAEGALGVKSRLQQGKLVAMAVDVPGPSRMRFLGHDVLGSSGAARIAFVAKRPVFPITCHRGADDAWFEVQDPLHPVDFADAGQLLQAMVEVHEKPAREWPESYDQPFAKWGRPEA